MKTPAFWFRPPGLLAAALTPLSWFWQLGGRLRPSRPAALQVPLIVVGNVVAGGAGKTPVTLALARQLQQMGLRVHLIARGHGGKLTGPLPVNPGRHTARDVGDEPLLLAQVAPTFIGTDRAAAARLAAQDCDVVISDDGLQNPHLKPDLALLVMDGVLDTGNGHIIPAGPLREPLAQALAKVAAIVQVGGTARDRGSTPVWMADFQPRDTGWLRGARVLAFAGLGQPEKFFATLTTSGAHLVAALPFADHHLFTEHEVRTLIRQADAQDAIPVTTAKDAVRLPWNLREQVRVVEGDLVWRDTAPVITALQQLTGCA